MGLGTFVSGGAFVGAVIATVMVLGIAAGHGKMTTTRLILAGTVVNALFTAFSNFIISVGANSLGGLAAIYSLYFDETFSTIFSVCGSFWYPGFADYVVNNLSLIHIY